MLWAAASAEETDTLKPRVISSHLPRGLPEIHSPPPRWGLRDEHLTYLTWLPTAGWHPASVIRECKRPCFINRLKECVCARVCVSDSATLWTVAHQAPQSMAFSRQEYWSGLPFPSPGHLHNPGDWTHVSCIGRQILYHWATQEAQEENGYMNPYGWTLSLPTWNCQNIVNRLYPQ